MLRILKRWLGWDSNSGPFDFSDLRFGARQNPSTSQPQAQQRPPATPRAEAPSRRAETPAGGSQPTQHAQPAAKPPAAKKAKKDRAPMDVLDNPQLTLDRPTAGDGFDPYNTGAFNRSASWEKIGRNKKR